jgi:hypothetical protein
MSIQVRSQHTGNGGGPNHVSYQSLELARTRPRGKEAARRAPMRRTIERADGNGTAAISGHRNRHNFRAGRSNYIYSQFYLFYITIFANYKEVLRVIHASSHSKIPRALFQRLSSNAYRKGRGRCTRCVCNVWHG